MQTQWLQPGEVGIDIRYDSFGTPCENTSGDQKDCGDENCPGYDGRCDSDVAEHGNAGIGARNFSASSCPEDGRHDRL